MIRLSYLFLFVLFIIITINFGLAYDKSSDQQFVNEELDDDFDEIKVRNLWNLVKKGGFSNAEMEQFKEELRFLQGRIKKLRHFEMKLEGINHIGGSKNKYNDEEKIKHEKDVKKRVKELQYKIKKLHTDLEERIMQRHVEL